MRANRLAAVVAAVMVLVVFTAGPASAVTYRERDRALASNYDVLNQPNGAACTHQWNSTPGTGYTALACFVPHGDYFYVFDALADGKSAVAYWVLLDGTRSGACRNALGAGTWARCNKNFTEGVYMSVRAGTYDGDTGVINDVAPTMYCNSATHIGCYAKYA